VLQPALRGSYLRELEDDARVIMGRLQADPGAGLFVVPTDRPDRQFFNLGLGATATFPGGHNVFLNYDADLSRDDLDTATLAGGFRLVF
jgi:hypothetical protein